MTYLEQEREARRLIAKYGNAWMQYDNEAIGEIINTVINARLKYNPALGKSTYLIKSVRRKIWRLNNKRIKNSMYEIPINTKSTKPNITDILDFIDNCKLLNDMEKQIVKRYYFDKMTMQEIGELYKFSKQRVSQYLSSGIEKLRRLKYVLAK